MKTASTKPAKPEASDYAFSVHVTSEIRTGRLVAVHLRIRKGRSAQTREFARGAVFADYDRRGRLVSVEVLGPCRLEVLEKIAAADVMTRRFICDSMPRKMLLGRKLTA